MEKQRKLYKSVSFYKLINMLIKYFEYCVFSLHLYTFFVVFAFISVVSCISDKLW